MFVRFRQTKHRLQLSLAETRRIDGRVRHEHIASLGSIENPPTVRARTAFWQLLHERLAKLSNRIGAHAVPVSISASITAGSRNAPSRTCRRSISARKPRPWNTSNRDRATVAVSTARSSATTRTVDRRRAVSARPTQQSGAARKLRYVDKTARSPTSTNHILLPKSCKCMTNSRSLDADKQNLTLSRRKESVVSV